MRSLITGADAPGGHPMGNQRLVPAIQELWNAWEIHCLIIVSLFLQIFLFLFAGRRQRSSGCIVHTVLWLAYLSADSVAVFVLGHLVVRARDPSHQLMSFWAPFVLVHLGGQDTITALSKQDNELWLRHLLNLVIQGVIAGYVVAKARWADVRLRRAVVLMFMSGCYKYAERTFILYTANPAQLRRWATTVFSSRLKGKQFMRGRPGLRTSDETSGEALTTMRKTLDQMSKGRPSESSLELYWDAVALTADIFCVDVPHNQAHTITAAAEAGDQLPKLLQKFLSTQGRLNAYDLVGAVVQFCYRRLYTKVPARQVFMPPSDAHAAAKIIIIIVMQLATSFPLISTSIALSLFVAAEKEQQQFHHFSKADVIVSYLLLAGAIALDLCSVTIFTLSQLRHKLPAPLANCVLQSVCCKKHWSEELGQYNLISSAHMETDGWDIFGCDIKRKPVSTAGRFILDSLLTFGAGGRWDIASTRGQVALHKWRADSAARMEILDKTLRIDDFPTSMLIFHLATDMCYDFGGGSTSTSSTTTTTTKNSHDQVEAKTISRDISNYIMYLVFKRGVMITTKSQLVHHHACAEIVKALRQAQVYPGHKDATAMKLFEQGEISIEHIIKPDDEQQNSGDNYEIQIADRQAPAAHNDNAADSHVKKLKQSTETLKALLLPRARAVAQELISIEDESDRWGLIADVWAEMLFYTAPRCGGGFHYEYLSKGGEFATHVLVLMYYLGPFLPPPDALAP